jgi:5-methylthioadenosine/S-adenosylhomocysteine deaminase
MASSFVLTGARVYRHGSDTDMPPVADVLVRDGRIVAIGPRLASDQHEAIDLSGHLLVPGFVNGHYHSHDVLAKGMFEAISLERWGIIAGAIGSNRPVEEVRLRTLVGALECAHNGITTIQDFANLSRYDPETIDAMIDAYTSVGVRVILSVTVRDKSQIDTILWADEMVPAEYHGLVGTGAGEGLTQVEFLGRQIDRIGDKAGRVIWAISPSAPQRCSLPLLQRVARFAGERDLPVYTHVYETRLQKLFARERLVEHGGSAIDYMAAAGLLGPRVTIAHGVWPDAREIGVLADTGTGVVLNMLSNLRLRSGVAPLAAYRRAGLGLSLGCDNCSCSDVQSMHQVMKLYCMLTGIADPGPERATAAEAVRMATEGGARGAALSGRIGAIEPGMAADLVAYDLADPAWRPFNSAARQLVYAETGRGLRHVWVSGERIVADGRSTRIDEAGVLRQVEAMMPQVRRDIDALARQADLVEPAMRAIQARAFATDVGYDRYLPRS